MLLLNLILFSLAIFNYNSFITMLILIIMILIKINKERKIDIFSIIVLLISLISIIFNRLYFIKNILIIIYYILLMFTYLTKKDLFMRYSTLFKKSNQKRDKTFIKMISFKECFQERFKINNSVLSNMHYNKNISYYYYVTKLSIDDTKEELQKKIKLYKDRGFFNKRKNRVIIKIRLKDLLVTLGYIILVIISIYWR